MEQQLKNIEKTYSIEKELGRGGMGVVYLATDRRLDRKVAIKVLNISGGNEKSDVPFEEVVQRFQREAKAVAQLTHPNIVSIYDVGSEDEAYYMVMEYVDGKSLYDRITSESMDIEVVLNVGIQLCGALDLAHENGIIHRDIKPANIILSKKGIAKLMDFGIAQLGKDSKRLTQSGTMLGSILYVSPEQLTDSSQVDARADIYSFGMSLYEMLTGGRLPFDGDNIPSLVMKIMTKEPIAPSNFNAEVPPELDRIILKSISKTPENRYQTISELGSDLSKLLSKINFEGNSSTNTNNQDFKSTMILNDAVKQQLSSSTMIVQPNSKVKELLRKTVINHAFIESLEKDYYWIKLLVKAMPCDISDTQDFYKVLAEVSFGNVFSGALIINGEIILFMHKGYLLGAIDTLNGNKNDKVIEHLTSIQIESIEIYTAFEEQKHIPVILASIISDSSPLQEDLDSSNIDLNPLVENLLSGISPFSGYVKCKSETNITYYGFADGKQIFEACVDEDDTEISKKDFRDLKNFVSNHSVLLSTFQISLNLLQPSIDKVLADCITSVKVREKSKSNLSKFLEFKANEMPNYLSKEIKHNVYTEIDMDKNLKMKVLDKDIDLLKIINDSINYKFSDWLINDYFHLINSTGNSPTLKYVSDFMPELTTIKFNVDLEDENSKKKNFDIVGFAKNDLTKPIFVAQIGNADRSDIDKFISDVNSIRKKYLKIDDFCAAFYISRNSFEENIIKLFYDNTVEYKKGFVFSLDRTSKYKGFVKIASNKGYHLHFIEFTERTFNILLPKLSD
ncbi:MAG: serine/threonine-protein kinase [Candidatus Sericytochromatia bacterium]